MIALVVVDACLGLAAMQGIVFPRSVSGSCSLSTSRSSTGSRRRAGGAPQLILEKFDRVDITTALEELKEQEPLDMNSISSVAEPSTEKPEFQWFEHWYPADVVATMDPTRPRSLRLLGLNLVAWNDGATVAGRKQDGTWRVFADSCPHRNAPLSEGRVEEDGNLLCSYHGWRFDGEGSCASLPYAVPEKQTRLRCSCRSQCGSYPTRVADGLLWVYPSCAPDALQASAKVPLPLIDELHSPELKDRWRWRIPAGVRDFPCGWDMMVENTLDPAHFCAAHHGTLGNRYTDPAPYAFGAVHTLDDETGAFQVDGDFGQLEFVPPCLVKYSPNYAGMPFNGSLVLATYCVPTRPGWVRPLANVLVDSEAVLGDTLAERALAIFMSGATPDWLGHILSSAVLHQDAGLLYKQYRNLRESGYGFRTPPPAWAINSPDDQRSPDDRRLEAATANADLPSPPPRRRASGAPSLQAASPRVEYEDLVFCPTSVDRGVLGFRRWLATSGGGGIPWACEDIVPPRGTEDIYDMWDAHTKHCSCCQVAYRNLEIARRASLAACATVVVLMPDGGERTFAALALASIAAALTKFNRLFRRYEFSHADND